jgi:hypothetical protein
MIRDVNGYSTHLHHIWFYVMPRRTIAILGIAAVWFFVLRPLRLFNQQGNRFHNESLTGGASATPSLLKQTPPRAWAVLDTNDSENGSRRSLLSRRR